jgi:hypothetical protein
VSCDDPRCRQAVSSRWATPRRTHGTPGVGTAQPQLDTAPTQCSLSPERSPSATPWLDLADARLFIRRPPRGLQFPRRIVWRFSLISQAMDRLRSSTTLQWSVLSTVMMLVWLRLASLGRYPEWDEAVFFSQSGGLWGSQAPPIPLAASREGGTPAVIGFLRVLGVELPGVRLGLLLLTFAVALWAFRRVGAHFSQTAGMVGFLVFGSFWTTLAFSSGMYGSLIWGSIALGILTMYMDLLDEAVPRRLIWGAGFGVAVAAMFWMRNLESLILIGLVGLHSIVWSRALVWRRNWRPLLMSVGAFLLTFAVPRVAWTISRWGSVVARLEALAGQIAGAAAQTENGLVVYWNSLTGGIPTFGLYGSKPTWVWPIVAIFLLVGLAAIVWALATSRRQTRAKLMVIALPMFVLAGYFAVIYTDAFRDRYLSGIVPLFAAALGVSGNLLVEGARTLRVKRLVLTVSIALLLFWIPSQLAIAEAYQSARTEHGDLSQRTADTIRSMASAESCQGVSRYGRVQVQLGSGCRVRSATTLDAAIDQLTKFSDDPGMIFLLWPNDTPDDEELTGTGWLRVDLSTTWSRLYLYVRLPKCADSADGSPSRDVPETCISG